MIYAVLWLIAVTMIPALELRASIPVGIFKMAEQVSWPIVVLVCVVANVILGWIVFLVMGPVFTFLRRWGWFDRRIWPILEKTQHKIHPYVEKYGEIGVAVFIGIPLPGSGVYTGAFGSYLLGLDRRKFAIANVIGVLIAAAAVTGVCMLILHGAVGEESWIAKLFMKKMH
ncbi:MAG: small multi-drug export protein [Verrucomicrobia bacterium]|jgi:uncharacterized membrane protein|nr:small multi-drug export protein [Verrucomicrobiota bacterium]